MPRMVKLLIDGVEGVEVRSDARLETEHFGLLNLLNRAIMGIYIQAVNGLLEAVLVSFLGVGQEKRIMVGDVIQLVDEPSHLHFQGRQIHGRFLEEVEIKREDREQKTNCCQDKAGELDARLERGRS